MFFRLASLSPRRWLGGRLTTSRCAGSTLGRGERWVTVSFNNFKSQNFKLSVSNPKSKS